MCGQEEADEEQLEQREDQREGRGRMFNKTNTKTWVEYKQMSSWCLSDTNQAVWQTEWKTENCLFLGHFGAFSLPSLVLYQGRIHPPHLFFGPLRPFDVPELTTVLFFFKSGVKYLIWPQFSQPNDGLQHWQWQLFGFCIDN